MSSAASTSCYHQEGLQSSQLVSEPRVLRLRFAAAPPPTDTNIIPYCSSSDHNVAGGGLSFLQCITTTTKENGYDDERQTHNRKSAALSKQSLEMCTESLGSETGSDDPCSIDDDQLMLQKSYRADDGFRQQQQQVEEEEEEKINPISTSTDTCASMRNRMQRRRRSGRRLQQFPPPLSSSGVEMRSHREDGRLVLTAVEASSCRAKFHAERSNGRLRLHLTTTADYYPTQEETEDQDTVRAEDEKTEHELVMPRGRCKETGEVNRGLLQNWEPFWVST